MVEDYRHFSHFAEEKWLPKPTPVKYVSKSSKTLIMILTEPCFALSKILSG